MSDQPLLPSEKGAEVFGAEQAKSMAEAGKAFKANGGNIVSPGVQCGRSNPG